MRVRGLKPSQFLLFDLHTLVAPRAGAWIETFVEIPIPDGDKQVAPRAGAWIETCCASFNSANFFVAPRAGAWIETYENDKDWGTGGVAPRAGAWIETALAPTKCLYRPVAPRAGAWIETENSGLPQTGQTSHPVRVRGLKQMVVRL